MYSNEFLENAHKSDKGFAFEYNILQTFKNNNSFAYDGYPFYNNLKSIGDGGFDFNISYKNRYFLIQAKCYSDYTDHLYEHYKKFIEDLKKQPIEYIGIFVIGTYSKLSVLNNMIGKNNIAEKLKKNINEKMNNSNHEIIICDDTQLMSFIKGGFIETEEEISFSRLRNFKLNEKIEHKFILKLNGIIKENINFSTSQLMILLHNDINLLRTRHQYIIDGKIKKIGYAGFDFIDYKRRYVIRYEIKNDLEYLKTCINDLDDSLNVFPNNMKAYFLTPNDVELNIDLHKYSKNFSHKIYVWGIDI
jgi:nitrogen regulatory protein PII-like uncharacterized protein